MIKMKEIIHNYFGEHREEVFKKNVVLLLFGILLILYFIGRQDGGRNQENYK